MRNRSLSVSFAIAWLLVGGAITGAAAARGSVSSPVDLKEQAELLNQLLHDHRWENALEVCTAILHQDIDNRYRAMILEKRGGLYCALDKYELGLADANAAAALAPKDADAYRLRSSAFVGLGRYREAVSNATHAIELQPDESDWWFHRGMAQFKFDYYSEAIDDFTKAIELKPAEGDFYFYRGLAAFSADRYELAEKDYTNVMKAESVNTTEASRYHLLGLTQFALGKRSDAQTSFERAAAVEAKTESEKLAKIASEYMEAWDFSTAFIYYERALSADPTNVTILCDCALAHSYACDFENAWKYLRKALQFGKPGLDEYMLRGWLNFVDGRYELSVQDDETVVRLRPEAPNVYLHLGIDYLVIGSRLKARDAFKTGLQLKFSPGTKAWLAIWYTLAGGRIDENTRAYLMQFSEQGWPFPLVRYYFGNLDEQAVLKLTKRRDIAFSSHLESQAYFYIGARLLSTNAAQARECFEKAASAVACMGETNYRTSNVLARKELEHDFLAPQDNRTTKSSPTK